MELLTKNYFLIQQFASTSNANFQPTAHTNLPSRAFSFYVSESFKSLSPQFPSLEVSRMKNLGVYQNTKQLVSN